MKVLVCDDQEDRAAAASDAISEGWVDGGDPEQLVEGDLTRALKELFDRAKKCVEKPDDFEPSGELDFDGYDLVIFDNNLAELDIGGARLTAEAMVGYVRAFSDTPYCVSLNKNPDVDFDLRFLVGDYETRADLALNYKHLEHRGLWTRRTEGKAMNFLPWYWPKLAVEPARRREQINFVCERLDEYILSALDLPSDDVSLGYLSPHGRGALVPSKPADEWKFIDVFRERDRSLPAESMERRAKLARAALAGGYIGKVAARVIAADLDLWFRRDLVAPQEMLVDIPHLLVRMPFLLNGDVSDIEAWKNATTAESEPYGLDPALYRDHLAAHEFSPSMWVQRPVFLWPHLKADEGLDEHFFNSVSSDSEVADVVFCEDLSTFAFRASEAAEVSPQEFMAEFEGAWTRRFVAKLEGYEYRPFSNFAA